ncbi:hypothetical protein PENSPDRAFT_476384 [Peniophora sp. CONT]|nr:hypothetical protein PENSPDRAFT_476384 [Peniophora sp. CONT]
MSDLRLTSTSIELSVASTQFALSSRWEMRSMPSETYRLLVDQLNIMFAQDGLRFHSRRQALPTPQSIAVEIDARFYDYVVLDGRRFHASSHANTPAQSLVEVHVPALNGVVRKEYGELVEILQYDQLPGGRCIWLGHIRWFTRWEGQLPPSWQSAQPETDVRHWKIAEYRSFKDDNFSYPFIHLTWIKGYLARSVVTIKGQKVWATKAIRRA